MVAARKATVNIFYQDNSQVADLISKFNKSFTYTDPASGESDTVSLVVFNADLRWANDWMPNKGDKMTIQILYQNWQDENSQIIFDCGKFCVDDLNFSGPELICTIQGVSVPEGNAFRSTIQNKTYKQITLKELATQISENYHLSLEYYGDTIKLETIEQTNETDCNFLQKICTDYGMAIKVYSGKIIIYDKGIFEAREPIKTIYLKDMQRWDYNSTLVGTYTGATIKYTTGQNNQELECSVGDGLRILNINEKVDNLADAQLKAYRKINTENEKAETMNITIMAEPFIAAGCTINISGLCKIDGKYFVDKVVHHIEAQGAYTMDLELHKCQERLPKISSGSGEAISTESEFKVGDKVIVNGKAYWGGNGGRANQCNHMTMYITQILGSNYKYQYGVAKRKGGTRYGWCAKDSLTKA